MKVIAMAVDGSGSWVYILYKLKVLPCSDLNFEAC